MERRREKRFNEKNKVLIKSAEEHKDTSVSINARAQTSDVSLAGARIQCKKDFPAGTVIRIVVDLGKSGDRVMVEAEVKWSRARGNGKGYEIGVEFLHNVSQTLQALLRHLYSVGNGRQATVTAAGTDRPS